MKKLQLYYALPLLLILFAIVSCDTESAYEQRVEEDDNRIKGFLAENGLDAERHSSGVYYKALNEESGGENIRAGDVVSIYYHMTTLDSVYEEMTTDSLNPIKLHQYNSSMVPTGLIDGLSMMSTGDKYRFYIPSYLAYDHYANNSYFNAHAIFIMDIEVVEVEETDDLLDGEMEAINNYIEEHNLDSIESFSSGLQYMVLEEGDGDQPSENNQVKLNYTLRYLDGTEVDEHDEVVSQVNDKYMVKGLLEGIKKMHEGETAMFIMPSEIAFGGSVAILPTEVREDLLDDGLIKYNVLPFTPIIYEIELVEVR